MNDVQLHLALTHVPVILSLTGLIMLIVAFFVKSNTLTKTAYIILFIAGMTALPVYFTGEGAEHAVEKLPGVSESIIESHEEAAEIAMITIAMAGLMALAGLLLHQWKSGTQILKICVLLIAVTAAGFMVQTAHLGGQIRHTEVRSDAALQNGNDNTQVEKNEQQQKNDD